MNHGFTVDMETLLRVMFRRHIDHYLINLIVALVKDKPIFSVQFHPEASPGPQDCYYIFEKFIKTIQSVNKRKSGAKKK